MNKLIAILAAVIVLSGLAAAAYARTYTSGSAPSPCNQALGSQSAEVGVGIYNNSNVDLEADLWCGSYGIHPVTSEGYTVATQYGGTTSSPQPWQTIDTHYDSVSPPNGYGVNLQDVFETPLTTYTGCGCERYRNETTFTVVSPGSLGTVINSTVVDSTVVLMDYAP